MRSFIACLALVLIIGLVGDASAFLGQRTFQFNYRQADVKHSSYDGYSATEKTFIVGASFPMNENVDLSAGAQWGKVEGNQGLKVSTSVYRAGALYHFFPGGVVDPYVGTSYNQISSTSETDFIAKETINTGSLTARTGAEVIINEQITIIPQYSYTRYFNDDLLDQDSTQGSITAVYWASGNVGLTVTYAHDFDDKSSLFTTGASFSL
ncbi:outer membrane beta-barrel protein [Nitrospirota bacterium]